MIVHIGYPKTGTTYLQSSILNNFSNLDFFGYKVCEQLFLPDIFMDELHYNEKHLQQKIQSLVGNYNSLFSFEALVGRAFHDNGSHSSKVARRLKQLGYSKVIITIRNQINIIDSLYREYVQQGGLDSFDDFVAPKNERRPVYFRKEYINYSRIISKYVDLFGIENVLVLLLEDLRHNEAAIVRKLEQFIGSEFLPINQEKGRSNKSISNPSIRILRFTNHFTFSILKPSHILSRHISTGKVRRLLKHIIDPLVFNRLFKRKNFLLQSKFKNSLVSYYADENQRISKDLIPNFKKYNYPLPGSSTTFE